MTSGLTFLTVLSLYLFGGEVLRGFSFALVIGILIGTYSSIAVAAPMLVAYQEWRGKRGPKRACCLRLNGARSEVTSRFTGCGKTRYTTARLKPCRPSAFSADILATVPDAGLHRGFFSLFAQSFSRMKAPAGGLISLFSHKVHSFFGELGGAGNATRRLRNLRKRPIGAVLAPEVRFSNV